MSVASDDALAALKSEYPTEATFSRKVLPRLGMISQDVMEGKGKAMKVVTEAGTFFTEVETDEIDPETKKKIWEKEELGDEIEGIILYQRKQLRYYDEANETYESTPVYDDENDILPLFSNKKEIDRGTAAELQSRPRFAGLTAKGKPKSKLEDNRILYVLYKGDIYQFNVRGTSMYAYKQYCRDLAAQNLSPNTQMTTFNSEARENGSTRWNQTTFVSARTITKEEASDVIEKVREIKEGIAVEKAFYASKTAAGPTQYDGETDEDFEARKKLLKNF